MAVDKKAKLRGKLIKLVSERRAVREQKDKLEAREKELGDEIKETMAKLGEDKAEMEDGGGYYLQRPTQTIYHEDTIRDLIAEKTPKLLRKVFPKVEHFDKDALSLLVDKGKLPEELLQDDKYIELKQQSPRLMPITENTKKREVKK